MLQSRLGLKLKNRFDGAQLQVGDAHPKIDGELHSRFMGVGEKRNVFAGELGAAADNRGERLRAQTFEGYASHQHDGKSAPKREVAHRGDIARGDQRAGEPAHFIRIEAESR